MRVRFWIGAVLLGAGVFGMSNSKGSGNSTDYFFVSVILAIIGAVLIFVPKRKKSKKI